TDFPLLHRGKAAMITNSQRTLGCIATACGHRVLFPAAPWPLQWHFAYLNCLAREHHPSSRFLVLLENMHHPLAPSLTRSLAHPADQVALVDRSATVHRNPRCAAAHWFAAAALRHQIHPVLRRAMAVHKYLRAELTRTLDKPLALDPVAADGRR